MINRAVMPTLPPLICSAIRTVENMKTLEQEYDEIKTVEERARWLLDKGVKAELTINPKKLEPAYVPKVCGWTLPGFYDTEEEAINAGAEFLRRKINPQNAEERDAEKCEHE